ncbi:hypothetical protein FSLSAGS3026_09490 [Streptococcus agalactiae FSL S3-026]|nr:hypothetical protein FSLSAGS3026_09490 [Streptococcus agalactiae FSL S3-026]
MKVSGILSETFLVFNIIFNRFSVLLVNKVSNQLEI